MPPKRTDLVDNESAGDRNAPMQSSITKIESGTVTVARVRPRSLVRQPPRPTDKRPAVPREPPIESFEPQLPRPPKLPTRLGVAEIPHPPALAEKPKAPRNSTTTDEAEEPTRTYPAEFVDALLRSSVEIPSTPPTFVADTNSRLSESPVEDPVVARQWNKKLDFGYDDVTQVYDPGVDSDLTAPSKRALYSKIPRASFVARTAQPRARHILGAAVFAALVGVCLLWAYRSPSLSQFRRIDDKSQTSSRNMNADGSRSNSLASSMINLSISVSPPEAVLSVDGRIVSNPFLGQRSSDTLTHLIVAEAPGHVALTRNVQFGRDLNVVLALATQPERVSLPPEPPSAGALNSPDVPRVKPAVKARSWQPTTLTKSTLDCSPPFTIDAEGIRTYKLECM